MMLTNRLHLLELIPSWPYAGTIENALNWQWIDALVVNARATMA